MTVKTILLIDDDPATNLINWRMIKNAKFAEKIIAHTNPKKALKYLRSKDATGAYPHPDYIFIDLNLPVISGWELLERFIAFEDEIKGNTIPIILTTSANEMHKKCALKYPELGGFFIKPLTAKILQELKTSNTKKTPQ